MISLNELSGRTHEAILLHIKKHGEMTVSELCDELKVTSMAIRRHLSGLKKDGLVECHIVNKGRGRPNYHFKLTPKAMSLFPSAEAGLASEIFDAVYEKNGAQGVMELLILRNDNLARKFASRMEGKNLADKIKEVAKIFADNGFMTEWQQLPDGNFMLFQKHCALHNLASRYRQLCGLEPRFIEALLKTKVTRTEYILNNDPVCGYLIQVNKNPAKSL